MFEELTTRKNFKTNKHKRPISFTQKSHFIKSIQEQKARIFCQNQKMGDLDPSVLLKRDIR